MEKEKKENNLKHIEKLDGMWGEFIWGLRYDIKMADRKLEQIKRYWKKIR